jgi:cation transport ATPase
MRFPDPREETHLLLPLAAYVGLSSFLGLTGLMFLAEGAIVEGIEMTVRAWVGAPVATVVFVAGSSASGLAALGAAREDRYSKAGILALVGSLVTYWMSFVVMTYITEPGSRASLGDLGEALGMVAALGSVGLAWATGAPLAWARWGEPRPQASTDGSPRSAE